jgi:hypothetical protein
MPEDLMSYSLLHKTQPKAKFFPNSSIFPGLVTNFGSNAFMILFYLLNFKQL